MRLCAVQCRPVPGDLDANLQRHLALAGAAAARRADLVLFPELSLTGYEPRLAADLAGDGGDPRFAPLQVLADKTGMLIAAGLPLQAPSGIRIGMLLWQPGGPLLRYAKQRLHADELPFFVPGDGQLILRAGGHAIAPAICYESLQAEHAGAAAALGADLYLASVAKPARNVVQAHAHYPQIARRHAMAVLMANSVGPCDDFIAAGGSAAWNAAGERLAQLDEHSEGLVLLDTGTGVAVALPLPPPA